MKKRKVVLISDTHARLHEINVPNGDIIIHCGDFGFRGATEEWKEFLTEYSKLPHKHKLFTFGNHDVRNSNLLPIIKQEAKDLGITLLVNELIEIDGLRIYGSPITPRFGNWWWMKERGAELARHWSNIPENLDIFFSHGMPHGVLDIAERIMEHVGDTELLMAIIEKKPKIGVGGHLHYQGGQSMIIGDTKYYNAAVCNESYYPSNKIQIIEI